MKFNLTCQVTVSAITEVEAESPEEAILIAKDRDIGLHFNGSGTDPEEVWCIEEADGSASNIRVQE